METWWFSIAAIAMLDYLRVFGSVKGGEIFQVNLDAS
jgi:hypothetical protein